jgi:hypothetical protein
MSNSFDSSTQKHFAQASIKTAKDLRTTALTLLREDISKMSLPEMEQAVEIISRMVPAGNVPGVILNGLARLSGQRPPPQIVKRDVNLLFRGVEQVLDAAVYSAVFAGPAAVIWGYQNMLKLAGKSPEAAFPEGTWQFYVDYALREDTARHANETHGFDTLLNGVKIKLTPQDRVTAWVMTAIFMLHDYTALLENEWRERVKTRLLCDVTVNLPEAKYYENLYREWEHQRPYARRADAGNDSYSLYRRKIFDAFLTDAMRNLPRNLLRQWQDAVSKAENETLPNYQRQMTVVSCLDPDAYGETRTALALKDTYIGVIYKGAYYLIPTCAEGTSRPADVKDVREQVAAIFSGAVKNERTQLASLASVRRSALPSLIKNLRPETAQSLQLLRCVPVLFNADRRNRRLALTELRQTERGIGNHALTIFDTGESFVFDQSHIYFDGAWGAALAEIMTGEALSWARYLAGLPASKANANRLKPLSITWQNAEKKHIAEAPRVVVEAGAENEQVNVKAILSLRKMFKQRSDLLQLTVNDLLVLYRAIHAQVYHPSATLIAQLEALQRQESTQRAAKTALEAIQKGHNPPVLIPIDASLSAPSERLYPMSFEVPLNDLNLIQQHHETLAALNEYEAASGSRKSQYAKFDRLQKKYLATLAGFGAVFHRAKAIALSGESASVGSIKLLAHMPKPLQRMLDLIPSKIDMLNDLIKGQEVFSNVGAVAPKSTLTRFITAKDDNEKKTLAWGILTDDAGMMHISLRDFRPHVSLLVEAGAREVAQYIVQEYLDTYALGINYYIRELRRITLASRETQTDNKGQD